MSQDVTLREKIGADEFDAMVTASEPADVPMLNILGASPWQSTFSSPVFTDDPLSESVTADGQGKDPKPEWRELQRQCYNKYRTFGPINATINSKSDYAGGSGFALYSENHQISRFINDLWYSHRNQMYTRITGWMIRMQAEVELFLLLAFDKEGKATLRTLEPSRIVGDTDDQSTGLITNPEDATQTLFYMHQNGEEEELIPDICIAYNPEELLKAAKTVEAFDETKTENSKAKTGKFSKIGKYRRFIIHWKNLTGISEYKRDTSNISAILESINLYWNAIKWQMDHKKAQAAYAMEFDFEENQSGKIAWMLYKKMTDTEKKAAGFSGALRPGSKIMTPPGVKLNIKNPQMQRMDGENRDLLNNAGAGLQSPTDMFQGDARGATDASIKSSRPPLELEIDNMQYKLANFVKFSVLRACFYVANQVSSFPETFDKAFVNSVYKGNKLTREIVMEKVEPIELVDAITPTIRFDTNPQEKASAFLGNNHFGLKGAGIVSDQGIADACGIKDLNRQRDENFLDDELYGKKELPVPGGMQPAGGESEETARYFTDKDGNLHERQGNGQLKMLAALKPLTES